MGRALQDKRWNVEVYEYGIHITANGNRVLVGIIVDAVEVP